MTDIEIIDLTPDNIAYYGVCGYKDVKKHLELRRKIGNHPQSLSGHIVNRCATYYETVTIRL